MLKGLNKLLRDGVPRLNSDLSISVIDETGKEIRRLPSSTLTQGGIGYVYERIVCLHYKALGYQVEHRASLGYNDCGVDLVAEKEEERIFVQCKFTLRSMGKQKIEQLLCAASSFVKANLCTHMNYFDLAVPSKALAFPHKRNNRAVNSAGSSAFLRYNQTQHAVTLRIVEIPMEIPSSFDIPNEQERGVEIVCGSSCLRSPG